MRFDTLPDDIRKLGPWQSLMRGDLDRLKTHYRLQLAEQGFVVHQSMGTFSPDQRWRRTAYITPQ